MRKCILLLLLVCLLSGCGKKDSDSGTGIFPTGGAIAGDSWLTEEENAPEATTTPLESDKEALADSIHLELLQNQLPNASEYLGNILDALIINVTDSSRDGDVITATVQITAPDMLWAAENLEEMSFRTKEEADTAICTMIPQAPGRTVTVTVTFHRGADRWVPEMTEELVDACYGGLLTYSQENGEVG